MKGYKIFLAGIFAALVLVACKAPMVPAPAMPNLGQDIVTLDLEYPAPATLDEDVVQLAEHSVKRGSSIVINVPAGIAAAQEQKQLAQEQMSKGRISLDEAMAGAGGVGTPSDDRGGDFYTDDFFNLAEQQIEKALISKGFRVLSRSKFEAKLRSLRDFSSNLYPSDDKGDVRRDMARDPAVAAAMEALEQQFKDGKMSTVQFKEEMAVLANDWETSVGRTRSGQNELIDISEVIRAAESGDVQADYVLQINTFEIDKPTVETTNLRKLPEVKKLLESNPEISEEFIRKYSSYNCAAIEAKLNAKLIHVKTGEIVWIGEHTLNELNAKLKEVVLKLGVEEVIANKPQVESFLRNENSEVRRKQRWKEEKLSGTVSQAPSYKVEKEIVPPKLITGNCTQAWTADSRENKQKLARLVAKDLMETLKIN